MMRKLRRCFSVSMLMMLLVIISTSSFVSAVPVTGTALKIRNTTLATTKVLNAYTDNTAVPNGTLCTIHTSSGSSFQKWYSIYVRLLPNNGPAVYRIEIGARRTAGLNYNQATSRCTIFTFSANSPSDFEIAFGSSGSNYSMWLPHYGQWARWLTAMSSTEGDPCKWLAVDGSYAQTWNITTW